MIKSLNFKKGTFIELSVNHGEEKKNMYIGRKQKQRYTSKNTNIG